MRQVLREDTLYPYLMKMLSAALRRRAARQPKAVLLMRI